MSHSFESTQQQQQQQHPPPPPPPPSAAPAIAVSLERLRHQLSSNTTTTTTTASPPPVSLSDPELYYNMSTSDSYIISDMAASSDHDDDLDSLPSISSSVLSSDSADSADAQREWEESLEQIQLLLTMVVVPFAGKYFGRKFAYWSWARYMEWAHNVEIRWTNKKTFKATGAAEAAATL